MADSFDPYYQWLGIEPTDQPPNHYRLLAIEPFMDNREVIAGAADRQMAHLRTFQRGPQATASQRLLNEVSIAKVSLLNPQKKAAYDEQLRKKLARGSGGSSRLILVGAAAAMVAIVLGVTVWMLAGPSEDDKVAQGNDRAAPRGEVDSTGAATARSKNDSGETASPQDNAGGESQTPGEKNPLKTNPPIATSPDKTGAPSAVPNDTPTDATTPAETQTPGDRGDHDRGDKKPPPETTSPSDTGETTGKQAAVGGDAPRTAKLPIPDLAAQQKAQAAVKTVFEYDKVTGRADRLRLAGEMIDEALQTDDDRTVQFVMLRISRDLGTHAGGVKTAFRAIDELDERFVIDAVAMRVQTITQVLRGDLSALERKQVVLYGLILVDELLLADQFQLGGRLTTQMDNAAGTLRDKSLSGAVEARRKRGRTLFKKYQRIEPALLTLKTAPDDPRANTQVGVYRCFVQGDWRRGLAMLARGDDAGLRQVAESENARPSVAAEQAALGDAWLALAETNQDEEVAHEMKVRAATWYRSALEGLTGFGRRRVEQQLKLLADLKSALPQVAADVAPVDIVAGAAKFAGPYEFFESDKRITGTQPDATILLRKDGKVIQDARPIATWRGGDGTLTIVYLDRARGTAQLKQKNEYELSGTRMSLDKQRTNVGLRRVRVVGVWEDVHSGGKVVDRLVLYSNARVNDPLGEVPWSLSARNLQIDKTQMYLRDNGRLFSGWREEEKSHYGRRLMRGILLDTRKTARAAAPPAAPPKLSAKEEELLIATYEMVGAAKGGGRSVSLTVDLNKDGRLMDHADEIGVWTHEGGRVTLQFIDPRLGVANLRLRSRSDLLGNSTGSDNVRWTWEFIRVKSRMQEVNSKKVTLYNNGRLDDPHAGKGYWYMSRGKPVLLNSW